MKLDSRLPDYLRHIQEAAQQTLAYVDGMDFAGFQADTRTQKAVLFNFVILGEASAKVMDKHSDFVGQHPEVPWRAIRNIRNQVAHGSSISTMRCFGHRSPQHCRRSCANCRL